MFNDVWLYSSVHMENPRLKHIHIDQFGGLAEREIQARVKQKDHMTMQKTWGKDKHNTQIHLLHCICNIGVKFDFAVQNSRKIFQLPI